ncbi:transposase [Mesorhizobium amorphae CCNWGS0123]|uniref:Transposase n=1 Tax=Mesorhizobium amorphae CCNWGS0123 TaxID=1082933 RepID=G6Y2U1_9HYPH|nr:transposase [Mesorhizobium amorphae CCNWGS0123]
MRAAMSAPRNKTDKADALGIADIMRTGLGSDRPTSNRKAAIGPNFHTPAQLKAKFLDLENAIRHSLKAFGIRLGKVRRRPSSRRSAPSPREIHYRPS